MDTPALDRFDLTSPAARADPHAVYRRMRLEGPLHRFTDPMSKAPAWVVISHAGARTVLKARDLFIRDRSRLLSEEQRAAAPAPPRGLEIIFGDMMHKDPPEHTRLRSLVQKSFTPRIVERLRTRARTLSHELLDAIDKDGASAFDLLDRFAVPLPITIIVELIGLPKSEAPRFRTWSRELFQDDFKRLIAAANEFRDFMLPIIDAREHDPGEDLLSALVHARTVDGSRLTRDELVSMAMLLMIAGHETTVNLLGNGVLALLRNPDALAELRADVPGRVGGAVEELLRYDGPADFATVRFALEDTELHGLPITRGEQVFVSMLAADRDPEVFADPDRLNVQRAPNPHIGFGSGIHACVGAPLARMEAAEALTALLERRPGLQLAAPADELQWLPSRMIHGLKALPVRGR